MHTLREGGVMEIQSEHIEAFKSLMKWCEENNACIYSDNDGMVWICIKNDHYRAQMIGKTLPCWQPFEHVEYTKVEL